MKRTPLFAAHQLLGGKLIEFGGWEMPVQYTSIVDEHQAVRSAAGLFNICHMGEFLLTGSAAEAFLNQTLTNDVRKLAPGQGQYTLLCNPAGGVVDDLYAYRLGPQRFLLIVNASRIEVDLAWMQSQLAGFSERHNVVLEDLSEATGALAVQGPRVVEFINGCFPGPAAGGTLVAQATELKKNQAGLFRVGQADVWVARTGYTGEDGFEIVAPAQEIERIWHELFAAGKAHGLKPAGLGARDTLRTEVCYPLYGHELDEVSTPIEAGLGFFVALDKGEFTGRAVLAAQKANGTARKLVAFKMSGKSAPPRPHYPIWSASASGQPIGQVASGTQSPSLNLGIGMGYVPVEHAKAQTPIQIEIRGNRAPALIEPKPLFRKAL